MITLSILIPTYNRANKLLRLLKIIDSELSMLNMSDSVHILVSDNASTDHTSKVISEISPKLLNLQYFRQQKNLGFDGNVNFLYEHNKADYGWYISDDEIIFPGALATILKALESHRPDLLLFSFCQPPGVKNDSFNFQNPIEVIRNTDEIIKLAYICPKISIYVLKKINFTSQQKAELSKFLNNGFFFIDLSYSVLGASKEPKLCVISEPLASCDEDYVEIGLDTKIILESYKILDHPFVQKYLLYLSRDMRNAAYYNAIQFLFAIKMGVLKASDMKKHEKAIKSTKIKIIPLLKRPKSLIQLFFLKNNCIGFYKKIKPLINFFRKFPTNLFDFKLK